MLGDVDLDVDLNVNLNATVIVDLANRVLGEGGRSRSPDPAALADRWGRGQSRRDGVDDKGGVQVQVQVNVNVIWRFAR